MSSDGAEDGGQVFEAGLVYVQLLLPALGQSSWLADESSTVCGWHSLRHSALPAEPGAAPTHEQDGDSVPALPAPV